MTQPLFDKGPPSPSTQNDAGKRPPGNVQFSTDSASGVIVGVDVTNSGSDGAAFMPMLDQLERRFERTPNEALIDSGFV